MSSQVMQDLMSWSQIVMAAAAVVTAAVATAAAVFAVYQLRAIRHQATAASTFELLKYIHDDVHTDARRHVLTKLRGKTDPMLWEDADIRAASQVAACYDIMGRSIKAGLVPARFFVPAAAASICRCFEIVEPFVLKISKEAGTDYWPEFRWLRAQALLEIARRTAKAEETPR